MELAEALIRPFLGGGRDDAFFGTNMMSRGNNSLAAQKLRE
jgi:hypothetical protein